MQSGDRERTRAERRGVGDCRGGSTLLPLALPIPPLATGVKVTVTERHKTLPMGVLGTPTAGTTATATAQVHLPNQDAITADAGAFIVCGVNTRLPTQFPDLGGLLGGIGLGSTMSVLMTDPLTGAVANPPQINAFQRAMLTNAVREAARYGSLNAGGEPGMLAVARSRTPSLGLTVSHFTATTAYDRIICTTRALDGARQIVWVARSCDTARTRDRLSICASYPFALISTRLVGMDTLTMRECTTVGIQLVRPLMGAGGGNTGGGYPPLLAPSASLSASGAATRRTISPDNRRGQYERSDDHATTAR